MFFASMIPSPSISGAANAFPFSVDDADPPFPENGIILLSPDLKNIDRFHCR
jgi:hypothetical protein